MYEQHLQSVVTFFNGGTIQRVSRAGGNANENYFVDTDSGSYVIKIMQEQYGIKDKHEEIIFIQRLKNAGFPVTGPLSSADGQYVYQGKDFIATMQTRLSADPPKPSLSVIAQIGSALAQLHGISTQGLPNKRHWLTHEYLPNAVELLRPYASTHDRVKDLIAYYRTLQTVFPGEDVIIHGDVFPDNTLFADGELAALIDWEEAGLGKAIVDFGMAVVGCCDSKDLPEKEAFFSLYNAYTAVRPFSEEEERLLESAVRFAAFTAAVWRFLHTNHYHPDEAKKNRYLLFWEMGLHEWKRPAAA